MQKSVQSFQDLRVYQLALKNSVDLHTLLQSLANDSDMGLVHQLLTTSHQVRACIAAAWGKRRDGPALMGHLSAAHFQSTEMPIWLEAAIHTGYLEPEVGQSLCDRYRYLSTALDQLMETTSIGIERGNTDLPATA